jgi:outer membrane protein OmpA-like peptidoglycan-associated protein
MFQVPLDAADPVSAAGQRYLSLREGSRVGGRYRLGALIERGSELAIFEALDEQTGHEVLIRLRPAPSAPDARLEHPGVAQFVDCGCIGTWFVSVLDPGEGESLSSVLRALTVDHVPLDELTALGVDLLSALDQAHQHGLAHGNLGIHSLHLTPTWGAVILDFPESVERLRDEALPFASPERFNGHRADERSDVYAVAALLYSLGTGEPPFGLSPHQARDGHLYQELPAHPSLPIPLFHVLATAMSKRPEHRYPTAAGFSAALLDAFQEIRSAEERQAKTRDDYGESSEALALAVDAVAHAARQASDGEAVPFDAPDSDVSEVTPLVDGDSVLEAGGYDLHEPVIDTMDPAPLRTEGPANDEAGRMSRAALLGRDADGEPAMSPELAELEALESQGSWVPVLLLAVLCLLAAGIAGAAMLLAGGLFALTTVTNQVAEQMVVEPAAAPVVAMPDRLDADVLAAPAADASLAQKAEAAAARNADPSPAQAAKAQSTSQVARTGNWDGRTSDPGVSAHGDMRVPVTFAYDSWEATPEPGFDAFMTAATTHEGRVRLTGHTDSFGSAQANRLMGLGRAWSVSMLMVAQGYDEGRVDLLSGGEDHPVADNRTEEGRAQNRRVTAEFTQERKVSDLLVQVQ